jgi:hypothetical protein
MFRAGMSKYAIENDRVSPTERVKMFEENNQEALRQTQFGIDYQIAVTIAV